MGIRGLILVGLSIAASACAHAQITASGTPLPSNEWSRVQKPTVGPSLPLGFYSNGCIRGAVSLPLDGGGYQVMRIFRNRYYGHPNLLEFLTNFGKTMDGLGSGLLIGDMGQVRGGPLPYGHASHQIGLDVDIWFWTHPEQRIRSLTADERNNLPMPTVLNANGLVDPAKFTKEHILKLKMAALDPKVERIFVNPAIKTYLCSTLPAEEHPWLHNLRPWPGHDDHFHVRIACPADDTSCVHQAPQDPGDGCKELMPDHTIDLEETTMEPKIEQLLDNNVPPALPAECTKVLREN